MIRTLIESLYPLSGGGVGCLPMGSPLHDDISRRGSKGSGRAEVPLEPQERFQDSSPKQMRVRSKRIRCPSIENTAHHEAGHAVVALHFGFPIKSVSILPDEDSLGKLLRPSLMMLSDYHDQRKLRRIVRESIIVSYAGFEAERIYDPGADESFAADDFNQAWNLPREHNVPINGCQSIGDDVYEAYLNRQRRETRRLVRKLWPAIRALAQELLKRKSLTAVIAQRIALPFLP